MMCTDSKMEEMAAAMKVPGDSTCVQKSSYKLTLRFAMRRTLENTQQPLKGTEVLQFMS